MINIPVSIGELYDKYTILEINKKTKNGRYRKIRNDR